MAASSTSPIEAGRLFSVPGLNAVITGGGSGLGAMMARALAVNGANKVFIIGRRSDALEKVASSVSTGNIIPLPGDVTSKESLQSCVDQVSSQVSHLDVVVCNSGISGPSMPQFKNPKTKEPLPFEEFQKNLWKPEMADVTSTFNVNISGVFYTAVAFLPLLYASITTAYPAPNPTNHPRPQIIMTSSVGAFNRQNMGNFSYGPSKAAVVHLMKQLSSSLTPYGIRTNAIAPGLYLTEMTESGYRALGYYDTHNREGTWPRSEMPLTRSGDEEDMAGVILWLCSRAGGYINGNVVVTDGGRLSVVPSTY